MADERIRPVGRIQETHAALPVSAQNMKERREAVELARVINRARKKSKKNKAAPEPSQPGGPGETPPHLDAKA